MMRLGIVGSTRGTNLEAIVQAIAQQQLAATISVVASNKADAFILQRAQAHGLLAHYVNPTGLTRDAFDQQLSVVLQQHQVDLIVLIGYMRILSASFIASWSNKIINVHPSLLPLHAGKMDLDVHRAVLAAQETESGCSVHFVTEQVDAGPIVVQKKCAVLPQDTAEMLKARVQALEGEALVEAIRELC